jgi:hypothetical protein
MTRGLGLLAEAGAGAGQRHHPGYFHWQAVPRAQDNLAPYIEKKIYSNRFNLVVGISKATGQNG